LDAEGRLLDCERFQTFSGLFRVSQLTFGEGPTEPSACLTHHRSWVVNSISSKAKFMRARSILVLAIIFSFSSISPAQVTHGQKPKLPAPFATNSAGNGPSRVKPPAGFLPTVPAGFQVNIFAKDFKVPRWLTAAPNGDIFLADTGAGEIIVLRDPQKTGGAQEREVFVDGMKRPFGIAFHENFVYVGNTNELVRFRYDPKTSKRLGEKEHLLDLPSGGHDTRSLAFSADGAHLLIGVGSDGNISVDNPPIRASITICDPNGKNARLYATGLRNPVGLAVEPVTGEVWATVNERDELGDDLPPDYFTSVKDGGFYGWPYSYIGDNVDPRVKPRRPDLVARAIIPDVLLDAHVAPLQFAFYTGKQFPESYRGGAFIAEHGSWNRARRSGYQIAFVAFKDGKPSADPVPFMTGLVPDPSKSDVYGRPVGVAVASDGSLLVSDDGAGALYRISVAK
jgi:glucose/arabinose dehydrogenase